VQLEKQQVTVIKHKIAELSKKAGLEQTPELQISKTEPLASVQVFRKQITVGENLLSHWQQGELDEKDVEAVLAHEIGHMMDLNRGFRSSSFRRLLGERMYFAFAIAPLLIYFVYPSSASLVLSLVCFMGWAVLLPWVFRRTKFHIELEADRNAARYLIEPQRLTELFEKKHVFAPVKNYGITKRVKHGVGMLTHPSLNERLHNLSVEAKKASKTQDANEQQQN
jgi:Zn-dependent protease with chaperone function